MKKDILIHIKSAFDAAGIKLAEEQLKTLSPRVAEIIKESAAAGQEMRKSFEPMTAITAALTGNFKEVGMQLVGLVQKVKNFGMSVAAFSGLTAVITAVGIGVGKLVGHFRKVKEAAEQTAEATRKNFAESLKESTKIIQDGLNAEVAALKKSLVTKNAELDLNQKLIESEIRLAKQREGASEAEVKAALEASRAKTAAAKAANEVSVGGDIETVRAKYKKDAQIAAKVYNDQIANYTFDAGDKIAKQRDKIRKSIYESRYENTLHDFQSEDGKEYLRRRVERELNEWRKENDEELLHGKEIAALMQAAKAAEQTVRDIDEATRKAAADRENAEKAAQAAANNAVAEEMKIQKQAQAKTDAEIHARRQQFLQDAILSHRSAAEGFVSDFANGGTGVTAEREREKTVAEMAKIADNTRWAGTTANLIAALNSGDKAAYQRELDWNRRYRSNGFTAEVEAAIRGTAEHRAGNALEDTVKRIENHTAGLAEKIDQLMAMK